MLPPKFNKLFFLFCLSIIVVFLGGCTHDISLCSSYSDYVVSIKALIDASYDVFFPVYIFIWSVVVVRKLFWV